MTFPVTEKAHVTNEVDKDSEQLVSALVQANKGLSEKTEKEVSAISEHVSNPVKRVNTGGEHGTLKLIN